MCRWYTIKVLLKSEEWKWVTNSLYLRTWVILIISTIFAILFVHQMAGWLGGWVRLGCKLDQAYIEKGKSDGVIINIKGLRCCRYLSDSDVTELYHFELSLSVLYFIGNRLLIESSSGLSLSVQKVFS